MSKFSNALDAVFGFQPSQKGATAVTPAQQNARDVADALATAPVLQRDENPPSAVANPKGVQPYSAVGRGVMPVQAGNPQAVPASRAAATDTDLLQYARARASLHSALNANEERTVDISSRLEGVQPPSAWSTLTLHEKMVANQKLIPSAGMETVLDNRDAILQGKNRRVQVGGPVKRARTQQEFLAQVMMPGNTIPTSAQVWPTGRSAAEAAVSDPMSLLTGDKPKTFRIKPGLADKGAGVKGQGGT
jgi:hypothetical protein